MKLLVLLIVSYAISCAAQSANDGLTLLNTVAKRYADAKSYRIEAIEEVSQQSELERTWEKTFLSAIVAPGGRYRYEGRSADGTAVFISDGTTKWVYHVDAQQYTQIAGPVEAPNANRLMPIDRAAENAKHIDLSHWLSGSLRSAVLLRDENLELNGRTIPCRVVRFTHADFRFHRKTDWKEDEEGTVWIDKSRMVIAKVRRRRKFSIPGSRPQRFELTTVYQVVDLDEREPEDSFIFSPPPQARRVTSFPELQLDPEATAAKFIGKPAPSLSLKATDGTFTNLTAFRGKPIFIEFWATWCGPCTELMPDLKKLYSETAGKGLVWITIDSDDEPAEVTAFLSRERIPWPNYHDDDGSWGRVFERQGIPLGVLIDANGNVAFYKAGYEISDLRAALVKLSSEFSSRANPNLK